MRPTLISIVLVFSSISIFAANRGDQMERPERVPAAGAFHHYILSPARQLNEQEQADLRSRGLRIDHALPGGKLLVHFTSDATIDASDPRIASLSDLNANRKLHRSAIREAVNGKPYSQLNVLFNDEVTFESAKAAIENAGGTLVEPLQHAFHVPNRITARIAASGVSTLAGDDRVMLVYGPMKLQIEPENAISAQLADVTPLFSAPYSLSGDGVTLSLFELAAADATHREFNGRLTVHGPFVGNANSDQQHATHVSGTMIAAGLDPSAKGMAPNATLHEYDANADDLFDLKQDLPGVSSRADNNSWGYVLGWCNSGKCTGQWVWSDSDIYFGGYDSLVTAPLDKITRDTGVLMVHSAGNDADKTGPGFTPFAHAHFDDNGNIETGYCYSANGSGTDCPAPACKAGAKFCETTRHPQLTSLLPPPWVSVGVTASAKNVITVGAIDSSKNIASFSSRGPARDGRVKPDLVARGVGVYSTQLNNQYASISGTSMASPAVAGSSALLIEQWRRTFGGANPSPAVLKTLMIATAQDLGNAGPDYTFGFGLLDAKAAVDTIIADGGGQRRIKIDSIATGGRVELPMTINGSGRLRVALGWSDPEVLTFPVDSGDPTDPLAAATLVNDLDLKVVDPSGNDVLPYVLDAQHPEVAATRGANHIDNTEEVEIANATPGIYKIIVTGTSITASSPQTYVLVSSADFGTAIVPCVDTFGANNSQANAYGNVVSSQTLTGRTCQATSVNVFKFVVDSPGTVNVTIKTNDTPVRVTLSSGATSTVTVDVPANSTRTVSTTYNGTTATTFFARVEPTGTIGSAPSYTITPTFPYSQQGRRRSVRAR